MVVVVSPITLPAPPALAAATMAARKPMCTLPRNTVVATVAPIIAAAMLSRNAEITNTSASSTSPPFQSSGRMRGSRCGNWLCSKCRDSSAKPTSSANRFARITHSCCRWNSRPTAPGAPWKSPNNTLYAVIATSPSSATDSVCRWNTATPSKVAPNSRNSIGIIPRAWERARR